MYIVHSPMSDIFTPLFCVILLLFFGKRADKKISGRKALPDICDIDLKKCVFIFSDFLIAEISMKFFCFPVIGNIKISEPNEE